jgi:hypothetical protein
MKQFVTDLAVDGSRPASPCAPDQLAAAVSPVVAAVQRSGGCGWQWQVSHPRSPLPRLHAQPAGMPAQVPNSLAEPLLPW